MPEAGHPVLPALLARLTESLGDARLDDGERRDLAAALAETPPSEESLRRLRNCAFGLVRDRTTDAESLELLRWLERVVRTLDVARGPNATVYSEVFFSPGPACLHAIQRQLRAARRSLDLCVFTLSDHRITADILAARARGVTVRMLTDNEKEGDAGSDVGRVRSAGVEVVVDRTSAHMHHKFAIVDGERLLNGSYNWTRSACDFNEENLIVTNDPALVERFTAQFERLWRALDRG